MATTKASDTTHMARAAVVDRCKLLAHPHHTHRTTAKTMPGAIRSARTTAIVSPKRGVGREVHGLLNPLPDETTYRRKPFAIRDRMSP